MFLTKECDYAIRVVRGLADLQMRPVQALCEREHVPRPFAYKILKKLEQKGIVRAQRGNAGGYQLAKTLADITLFDVVEAVDDHLFLNECLQAEHVCPHNMNGIFCGVHHELSRIQHILTNALNEKRMSDLV